MPKHLETDLYAPIKAYLSAQGYEVKGEIGPADVMAVRGDEPMVIVELKTAFSLALVHQGIARQSVTDFVYLAVPHETGRAYAKRMIDNINLCRRLGLGLISVRLRDGFVQTHCDPGPFRPRKSQPRAQRLLREFERRVGDPSTGGSARTKIVTAYRQDALQIAVFLLKNGPTKGSVVAKSTGVERATRMMANDHYGWFERVEQGVYAITPKGGIEVPEFGTIDSAD